MNITDIKQKKYEKIFVPPRTIFIHIDTTKVISIKEKYFLKKNIHLPLN